MQSVRLRLTSIVVLMLVSVSFITGGCSSPASPSAPAPVTSAPVPSVTAPTVPPLTTTAPTPVPTTPAVQPPTPVPTPAPAPGPNNIWLLGAQYVPATLTVPVGTIVTWTNKEADIHTVDSYDGLFVSGPLYLGQTFSYTFTKSGTFNYYCKPHPDMFGTIIVK